MPEDTERLARELVEMMREDQRVRDRLAADGSLFEGYHPIMEAVHRHNAARLRMIIDERGWPGRSLVGDEAADAAWRIALHAISEPRFQRRCLDLLHDAVERGEVPAAHAAFLEDRIRVYEGRGQLYGTQFDLGPNRTHVPFPIEDPDHLDDRRASVGLGPFAEQLAGLGPAPEIDPELQARRERGYQQWLRDVGWRP